MSILEGFKDADVKSFMNHMAELAMVHVKKGVDPEEALKLAAIEYKAFLENLKRPEVREAMVNKAVTAVWHAVNDPK